MSCARPGLPIGKPDELIGSQSHSAGSGYFQCTILGTVVAVVA